MGRCILPLGDSLTAFKPNNYGPGVLHPKFLAEHAGDVAGDSWRYALWKLLIDAGVAGDIRYVGSAEEVAVGSELQDYRARRFPRRHEGHHGWTIDDILAGADHPHRLPQGKLALWKEGYRCRPDCVLIQLGANDVGFGHSPESSVEGLKQAMALLQEDFRDVPILLANLIPTCHDKALAKRTSRAIDDAFIEHGPRSSAQRVVAVQVASNATLSGRPSTNLLDLSQVHVVDFFHMRNFSRQRDTYDGSHPVISAQKKIAAKWFEAMQRHCPKIFEPDTGTTGAPFTATATPSLGLLIVSDTGLLFETESIVGGQCIFVAEALAALPALCLAIRFASRRLRSRAESAMIADKEEAKLAPPDAIIDV